MRVLLPATVGDGVCAGSVAFSLSVSSLLRDAGACTVVLPQPSPPLRRGLRFHLGALPPAAGSGSRFAARRWQPSAFCDLRFSCRHPGDPGGPHGMCYDCVTTEQTRVTRSPGRGQPRDMWGGTGVEYQLVCFCG